MRSAPRETEPQLQKCTNICLRWQSRRQTGFFLCRRGSVGRAHTGAADCERQISSTHFNSICSFWSLKVAAGVLPKVWPAPLSVLSDAAEATAKLSTAVSQFKFSGTKLHWTCVTSSWKCIISTQLRGPCRLLSIACLLRFEDVKTTRQNSVRALFDSVQNKPDDANSQKPEVKRSRLSPKTASFLSTLD